MKDNNFELNQEQIINASPFRVVVYARTSTIGQADEEKISIPDQISWAENLCKERGWHYVRSYIDTLPGDVEFDKRPEGNILLEDAKFKQFNLVLLFHSSRLAREPWVGLKTISILGKSGIQTYIRNAPIEPLLPQNYIYGANVASEYLNALSLVGDKQENIARSERVTSGFKNLAQRGVLVFAPYGYRKIPKIEITSDGRQIYSWSFEIEPTEAIVVKRIFDKYSSGESLRKIVKELITDKIPSPSGKTGLGSWSAATIKNILSNPTYCGKLRWGRKLGSKYRQGRGENGKQKRTYTNSEKWILSNSTNSPIIISDELFSHVQERLKQRGKVAGRQLASDSLLTGLVYCGDCQRRAYSKTRKIRKNGNVYIRTDYIDQSYFRGLDCRRHLMSSVKLEQLVLLQLEMRLKQLNEVDVEKELSIKEVSSKLLLEESVSQIVRQLKSQELKQARLMDIYLGGSLSKEEYSTQKEKLDAENTVLIQEQNRLIAMMNDTEKKVQAIKTLKQLLNMFSATEDTRVKKEMLQRIIEAIVIYKDRIELVYKYSSGGAYGLNVKPHPCGYLGDPNHDCRCTTSEILRYQKKISGPMMDRIDIHLDVPAVKTDKLILDKSSNGPTSKEIRNIVQKARDLQSKRYKKDKIISNSEMNSKHIKKYCILSLDSLEILKMAVNKLNLSARSYNKILKISRTIADLDASKNINPDHIAEALQYRPKIDTI